MEKIVRLKIYYNLVSFISIILLVFLLVIQSIWVWGGSSSAIITQVSLQNARVQAISKDVLLLAYYPTTQSKAVSELQDSLPVLEKTQAGLQSGSVALMLPRHVPDDVQQALTLAQPDYIAIDVAASHILNQAQQHKPIDAIQLSIVLEHEHAYSVAMAQVRTLWTQRINNAFSTLFYIESVLTIVAIITVIIRYLLVHKIPTLTLKETEDKQHGHSTNN
jgi:hypothetical protein